MFKIGYIHELLSGNLTEKGYKNFLSRIYFLIKKHQWSKNIIVSGNTNSEHWTIDDVKELLQQFFMYSIEKRKFVYLEKIPESYLSYYFTQIFISFVANRISEEQQKSGLSFEKCKELVMSIADEKYIINQIDSIDYVFTTPFEEKAINQNINFEKELKYLSRIPILESTKHFKPLVTTALEDVFNMIDAPIAVPKLVELVFNLLDQKAFANIDFVEETYEYVYSDADYAKFKSAIKNIVTRLSKDDANLISEYLFQTQTQVSLSDLAEKYGIPKSSAHYKVDTFKKKIAENYVPENEEEGVCFIKNLSAALDEIGK